MSSVFVSKRIESLLSQEHAGELHILEYKFSKVEYHTSQALKWKLYVLSILLGHGVQFLVNPLLFLLEKLLYQDLRTLMFCFYKIGFPCAKRNGSEKISFFCRDGRDCKADSQGSYSFAFLLIKRSGGIKPQQPKQSLIKSGRVCNWSPMQKILGF